MKDMQRITALLGITERGKGKKLIEMLDKQGITVHLHCVGVGTASSDMMDILGLDSSDKDVIISMATYGAVLGLAEQLGDELSNRRNLSGLLMILSPDAAGKLMSAIIVHNTPDTADKGEGGTVMESNHKFSLVLISVNQGYSEKVMHTARRAGATGGTVIRARMDGTDMIEDAIGKAVPAEKEIVSILAPDNVRNKILEDVNAEFGLRTEANGLVFSLPVEKAFKI